MTLNLHTNGFNGFRTMVSVRQDVFDDLKLRDTTDPRRTTPEDELVTVGIFDLSMEKDVGFDRGLYILDREDNMYRMTPGKDFRVAVSTNGTPVLEIDAGCDPVLNAIHRTRRLYVLVHRSERIEQSPDLAATIMNIFRGIMNHSDTECIANVDWSLMADQEIVKVTGGSDADGVERSGRVAFVPNGAHGFADGEYRDPGLFYLHSDKSMYRLQAGFDYLWDVSVGDSREELDWLEIKILKTSRILNNMEGDARFVLVTSHKSHQTMISNNGDKAISVFEATHRDITGDQLRRLLTIQTGGGYALGTTTGTPSNLSAIMKTLVDKGIGLKIAVNTIAAHQPCTNIRFDTTSIGGIRHLHSLELKPVLDKETGEFRAHVIAECVTEFSNQRLIPTMDQTRALCRARTVTKEDIGRLVMSDEYPES